MIPMETWNLKKNCAQEYLILHYYSLYGTEIFLKYILVIRNNHNSVKYDLTVITYNNKSEGVEDNR